MSNVESNAGWDQACDSLLSAPKIWLVTGVAGFIGSNLLEALLKLNQKVVGLDNFETGQMKNLDEVRTLVPASSWSNFYFIEGDIAEPRDCEACFSTPLGQVDYVLHQAALGSVPRSIKNPAATNRANVTGFLNVLIAARDARVKTFVYAASSSTYGDHQTLPKVESVIGQPLSPYAVTKYMNELYANVFGRIYGMRTVGLRYFNVFGPRQDPEGAYAAVIPKWIASMLRRESVYINGDGETSRDFCFVRNAVQANFLAALASDEAVNNVYNIAFGERTTLTDLFCYIREQLGSQGVDYPLEPVYREFRSGDVRHSLADIGKGRNLLGYNPEISVRDGIKQAIGWYVNALGSEEAG